MSESKTMRAGTVQSQGLVQFLRRVPGIKGLRSRTREELAFLRHVWEQGLWQELLRRNFRRQVRQLQKPLVCEAAFHLSESPEGLRSQLRERGITFCEGGHAWYIPPQPRLAESFGRFVENYPGDAGYKLLKNTGGPEEVNYVSKNQSYFWMGGVVVGKARDLLPVGNYLFELGVAPRIYDLAELSSGSQRISMFVMQHVGEGKPTHDEWREFIQTLRGYIKKRLVMTTTPNWEHNDDFVAPDCNGNLVKSEDTGKVYFVDTQNFLFPNYEKHLRHKIEETVGAAHFGHKHLLRGGRYLYQQVPGVAETGKRGTRERWSRINSLLLEKGIDIKGRLVMDIGCNSGMMLAEALNTGARWGLGWDKPEVVAKARSLLWALGYTRYDLIGRSLVKNSPLPADVPAHLSASVSESVVLYLAIRHHIGFIDALQQLRWKALVYEGSQDENPEQLREIIHEFQALIPSEVIDAGAVRDGDCTTRPLLLFLRREGTPSGAAKHAPSGAQTAE